jgi:RimJ/RimL family protein N-acetyltransferase
MRIERWDPADIDSAAALYGVRKAAHEADEPVEPPKSLATFRGMLTGEWEGDQGEVWYTTADKTGENELSGYYRLDLPDLENRDRAFAHLFVRPRARRRGLGTELARHAAQRAAANGRAIMEGCVLDDSPGEAFAAKLGATVALREARRVQDLTKVSAERIASLRAEAEREAAGYELVTWTGPIPDKYAGHVAEVFNAFADAPHGEGTQPEVWDADRIRQRTGKLLREAGLHGYSIAVMHAGCGQMVAITEIVVDPRVPEWGYQQLTAVTRPHRGHRLGLLTKTAMLQWLAKTEPQLRKIETGNAVTNDHMIAVNEALGYELMPPSWQFYEIPVEKVS